MNSANRRGAKPSPKVRASFFGSPEHGRILDFSEPIALLVLQAVKMRVETFLVADEFLVRAAGNHSALLHDMDGCGVANG